MTLSKYLISVSLLPAIAVQAQIESPNPSQVFAEVDSSHSEISVGWRAESNVADFVECGDGWRGWHALGSTALRLSADLVAWGGAMYEDGCRLNVLWSESSDYEEVGPMAVADTVGGDKDSEKYAFLAGFAWRGRRAAVGLQIDYSSQSEYRTQDPRPKADAVCAKVKLGGDISFSESQSVGLYGVLRKYSQELDIDFKNIYAASMTLYQLTGLGSDYSRFSGDNDEASYKGRLAGGGITYVGTISALVEFSRRHAEKILPDLQNAVTNETYDNAMHFQVSRFGALGHWNTDLALKSNVSRLKLNTFIYDDGAMNYRQISTRCPYSRNLYSLGISAKASNPVAHGLVLFADISYNSAEEENTDVRRDLTVSDISIRLSADASNSLRRSSIAYGLSLLRRQNILHEANFGVRRNTESRLALVALNQDFELRSASLSGFDVHTRLDIRLSRWADTVFVGAQGGAAWRSGSLPSVWTVSVSAGVTL